MLEYDDARSGSFEPLKEVPEGTIAVLGLVSTKTARRETMEELVVRITEASQVLPLPMLGLSPQCGFASSIIGNRLSPDDQKEKLRLVVETARVVWGEG